MVLLAGLAMGGCAQASGNVRLDCRVQGDAAKALCQAVRDRLAQQDLQSGPAAAVQLLLEASSPVPTRLVARLSVTRAGMYQPGQQGELAVIDRGTIPQRQLDDFAAALIDRAGIGF